MSSLNQSLAAPTAAEVSPVSRTVVKKCKHCRKDPEFCGCCQASRDAQHEPDPKPMVMCLSEAWLFDVWCKKRGRSGAMDCSPGTHKKIDWGTT